MRSRRFGDFFKHDITKEGYILLFLAGVILTFIRSANDFYTPIFYAEDGLWVSSILRNGFWSTLWHAKRTYFVFGNILLIAISMFLNWIFNGQDLSHLPLFIAGVSYVFYSLLALLPVACFKKEISKGYRLLVWALVLLVPLGDTGPEILGKVLNSGYLFFFLAFCLAFYLVFYPCSHLKTVLINVVLFISCATNPACFLVAGGGFLLDFLLYYFQQRANGCRLKYILLNYLKAFKSKCWLVLCAVCGAMACYIVFFMLFTDNTYKGEYLLSVLPEFWARTVLFYIVHPIWQKLNAALVLLFSALVTAVVGVTLWKGESQQRLKLLVCIGGLLAYTCVTFLLRPWVLTQIKGYQTTFPDRYFYGVNILTLLPIFYIASIWEKKWKGAIKAVRSRLAVVAVRCAAALLVLSAVLNPRLFQLILPLTQSPPSFKQNIWVSFQEEASEELENKIYAKVNIEPAGWKMLLPQSHMVASLLGQREGVLTASNVSNEEWQKGVSTQGGMLLLDASYNPILQKAKILRCGEAAVTIDGVEPDGKYFRVHCSGGDIGAFAYPAKITPEW